MAVNKQTIKNILNDMFGEIDFINLNILDEAADESYENYTVSSKYMIPNNGNVSDNVYNELTNIVSKQLFNYVANTLFNGFDTTDTVNYTRENENEFNDFVNELPYSHVDYVIGFGHSMNERRFDGYDRLNNTFRSSVYKYLTNQTSNVYVNESKSFENDNIEVLNYDSDITVSIADIVVEENINNNELLINITIPYKFTMPTNFTKYEVTFNQD